VFEAPERQEIEDMAISDAREKDLQTPTVLYLPEDIAAKKKRFWQLHHEKIPPFLSVAAPSRMRQRSEGAPERGKCEAEMTRERK
jgi:hypothetical protein